MASRSCSPCYTTPLFARSNALVMTLLVGKRASRTPLVMCIGREIRTE